MGRTVKLIVNGDDFGRAPSVNDAIVQAHCAGVLTSASLMVTGRAWREAVELARQMPSLAVGLHVVVAGGGSVLGPGRLPHLVDGRGDFRGSPLAIGLRYAFSRTARAELAQELAAQFERFAQTGLVLSHVDGHLHMHMHPEVFERLLDLAEQYGAYGLRLPRDQLWLAVRYDARRLLVKATWAGVFGLLSRRAQWRLTRRAGQTDPIRGAGSRRRLFVVDRVYGLMQTGRMETGYVVQLLDRSPAATAELYCHPATVALGEALGPNPRDLATLLDPATRIALERGGHQLTTYAELAEG